MRQPVVIRAGPWDAPDRGSGARRPLLSPLDASDVVTPLLERLRPHRHHLHVPVDRSLGIQ